MKPGDMVKASYFRANTPGPEFIGVIVDINDVTDLFSEEYSIMETNTYVCVLIDGKIMSFEIGEDKIEVIHASR